MPRVIRPKEFPKSSEIVNTPLDRCVAAGDFSVFMQALVSLPSLVAHADGGVFVQTAIDVTAP